MREGRGVPSLAQRFRSGQQFAGTRHADPASGGSDVRAPCSLHVSANHPWSATPRDLSYSLVEWDFGQSPGLQKRETWGARVFRRSLIHRLCQRCRRTAGEICAAVVRRRDTVRARRQLRRCELCLASAQGHSLQERRAIVEGNFPGGRSDDSPMTSGQ